MLKKAITYENFDGEKVTEIFYFNLTKPELLEMESAYEGGLGATLQRIIDAQDMGKLLVEFKKIILASFGEKSSDGKRFIKSDELREGFSQTAAYAELFMELAMDADQAAEFVKGVIPKDLNTTELNKALAAAQTPETVPETVPPTEPKEA